MATYTPNDVKTLEYSDDSGSTWNSVNFFGPAEFSIEETAVRQEVNEGKQLTAMKEVVVNAELFDHDLLTTLRTAESDYTELQWRVTMLDDSTRTTQDAPVSVERTIEQQDGLQGYVILSDYRTDRATTPITDA